MGEASRSSKQYWDNQEDGCEVSVLLAKDQSSSFTFHKNKKITKQYFVSELDFILQDQESWQLLLGCPSFLEVTPAPGGGPRPHKQVFPFGSLGQDTWPPLVSQSSTS